MNMLDYFIDRLKMNTAKPECRKCSRFQLFVGQLETDFLAKGYSKLEELKTAKEEQIKSPDCKPCPPAEIFSDYSTCGDGGDCGCSV